MKLLIIRATRATGREIVSRALTQGHAVTDDDIGDFLRQQLRGEANHKPTDYNPQTYQPEKSTL
jgi:hypothetical protein